VLNPLPASGQVRVTDPAGPATAVCGVEGSDSPYAVATVIS